MSQFRDLPVSVELTGLLGQEVTAWVEVEAGWQVVAGHGPPAPVLALAGATVPGRSSVVVVEGAPSTAEVREHLLAGAVDVLGWPDDRDRLLAAPGRVRAAGRTGTGPRVLALAGVAGGVGTSTVALGVAGLLAWTGRRTVVVGDEDLLALCGLDDWRGPGAGELAALDPAAAAAELPGLTRRVAGIDGLTALAGRDGTVPDCASWPVDAAVIDRGVTGARDVAGAWGAGTRGVMGQRGVAGERSVTLLDLAVTRPDVGVRAAAGLPGSVPVVVVGRGPLDRAGVRRVLGRAPVGWLQDSARVARAGLAGRVPSALPGAWVADLRGIVGRVAR